MISITRSYARATCSFANQNAVFNARMRIRFRGAGHRLGAAWTVAFVLVAALVALALAGANAALERASHSNPKF